jgi:tetratricopeptide (TPR) repeat protein
MKYSGLAWIAAFLLVPLAAYAQEPPPQPPAAPQEVSETPIQQIEQRARTPREQAELRGDVMMARKRYSEAVEVYEEILKKEPRNAALLNKVGIAYHNLNNLRQARRYYQRAIRADRRFANAYNNLGAIYYQQKSYRRAEREYRRAIEIRPDAAIFHSNLASAQFARERYDAALYSLVRALEIDPQLFERRSGVGSVVQNPPVGDRSKFFFVMAKSFALLGDAERCAFFLARARDAGYPDLAAVTSDESFALVLESPLIQQILHPESVATAPPGF